MSIIIIKYELDLGLIVKINILNLIRLYTRLHKLGICMSHKSTVRLLDKLGEGHDAEVHRRREDLLTHIELNKVQ